MYEFAYNEVIENSRQTMRASERAAMDRVIAMLRAGQNKGPSRASESKRSSISSACGRSF